MLAVGHAEGADVSDRSELSVGVPEQGVERNDKACPISADRIILGEIRLSLPP